MEIDPRKTGVSSVKNVLTLRAALRGSELPIPRSMQVEPEESFRQDAVGEILSFQGGERPALDEPKGSPLAPSAHFQPK